MESRPLAPLKAKLSFIPPSPHLPANQCFGVVIVASFSEAIPNFVSQALSSPVATIAAGIVIIDPINCLRDGSGISDGAAPTLKPGRISPILSLLS
jgi:hypothetical protein